mmetsp:Transcript_37007/g.86041  ORF Transcript_37007/g.86041 Transcript_37007/m.86041 type:complete len:83 (+) Transcript_37007:846-1094(+)
MSMAVCKQDPWFNVVVPKVKNYGTTIGNTSQNRMTVIRGRARQTPDPVVCSPTCYDFPRHNIPSKEEPLLSHRVDSDIIAAD